MKFLLLKQLIVLIVTGMSVTLGFSQEITQNIRGIVRDEASGMPLPGATVVIADSDPVIGEITSYDGSFKLKNIPIGRVDLMISFIGYEPKVIPNVRIGAAKEIVLEINLQESLVKMDEVVIKAEKNRGEVLNDMSLISARGFTVEETKRYAGSFNDPARMVSAYAGVTSDPTGENSIIVRGNSPTGIQWRLEGIEIPNPNHFANEGMTGGSINVLNSNMLAASDFFSGAFAPEYGNVLSGIFDMNMRTGNNQKREYSVAVGVIGTDVSLEGPFHKSYKGSYLINYRYSTLTILNDLGLVDFEGVPKYQDLSFKINLPTGPRSELTFFGVGGDSHIFATEYQDDTETLKAYEGDYGSDMAVGGVKYTQYLSDKMKIWTIISVGQNGSSILEDKYVTPEEPIRSFDMDLNKRNYKWLGRMQYKLDAQNKLLTGFELTRYDFDFILYNLKNQEDLVKILDDSGHVNLYQGFVSWRHRFTERLSMVSGLHFMQLDLNSQKALEPRFSAQYAINSHQTLSFGIGWHSKMHSPSQYYSLIYPEDGNPIRPNLGMDFSKARHYVLGYQSQIGPNTRMKVEAYYQDLYHIPVEDDPESSYSILNAETGYLDKKLVNSGTGENYGLEFTLERMLHNHFYYLWTVSAFDAKYTALNGVKRNTRFNTQYVTNLLFGKEFVFGSAQKPRSIGVNGRFSLMGGRYYTPIDLEASREADEEILVDKPWSEKREPVFQMNLGVTYRVESKKISQELKLDIQNVTNAQSVIGQYYDDFSNDIESFYQLEMLPVIYYKIYF